MPLALELAAGWLKALTLEEIVTEITGGIDVLQASARDIPDRHRSIRAVFDSSWGLLPESERGVLRRLSVFRGGFRRDAASVVAGASLISLGHLVDRSLLSLSSEGRYGLHPLLLEYVGERLEELRIFELQSDDTEILNLLGKVATRMGKFAEAEGYLLGALRLVSGSEKTLLANLAMVQSLGELRIAEGELEAGAVWLSSVVHHAASGSRAGAECRRLLEDLRDQLSPGELAAAVSRGKGMTMDDVLNELPPTL